jgi:predicted amidohydrolase YtcJ
MEELATVIDNPFAAEVVSRVDRSRTGMSILIQNASILTLNEHYPMANRIGIASGVIVGLDEELEGMRFDTTVDAHGSVIVPGFNDAHAHSVWFGLTLSELDLSRAGSVKDIYQLLASHSRRLKKGEWLIAAGFNPLAFGGMTLAIAEVDTAVGERPVWIKHTSGHACFANTAALRIIGIERHLHDGIPGGVVVVNDHGSPTGVLEENAMRLVQNEGLPYSVIDIEEALGRATKHYLTEGITSVTDAGIAGGWIGHSPREFAAYQNALETDRLLTRMQTMISLDALHSLGGNAADPEILGLDAGIRTGVGGARLQVGPAKVFIDGSLLGSTAYMTDGYEGNLHNHGYLQQAPDEVRDLALRAYRGGWSLAMHAIGDGAVDLAIEIIGSAEKSFGRHRIPNRIEHGGVIRPDQLSALAEAGIAVVPQPHFITTYGDGMLDRLGPARSAWSYRARSLLDGGLWLPGSSDRPVANGAPLAVMQSFVERLTASGVVYGEAERITALQALHAYTRGSAEVTGWGGKKGRLMRGMLADLAVLADDPTKVGSDRIGSIEVLATVLDGDFVFDGVGMAPNQSGPPTRPAAPHD